MFIIIVMEQTSKTWNNLKCDSKAICKLVDNNFMNMTLFGQWNYIIHFFMREAF